MDEKKPLTKEQAIIKMWAHRRGIEPPPGTEPDKFGLLYGSCVKFGLGKPNEDDVALMGRLKLEGYSVKESKDGISWEWSIPAERAAANLKAQHDKAIAQTRPTRNEIVKPNEESEGYYDIPSTLDIGPVTLESILPSAPMTEAEIQMREEAGMSAKD